MRVIRSETVSCPPNGGWPGPTVARQHYSGGGWNLSSDDPDCAAAVKMAGGMRAQPSRKDIDTIKYGPQKRVKLLGIVTSFDKCDYEFATITLYYYYRVVLQLTALSMHCAIINIYVAKSNSTHFIKL